ncbi:MAG: aminotransferase class IV [Acidimicrobiia bacterium]
MDGALYDRDSLPPDLAIRFGTSLGLSPVCYLRENLLLAQHLAVLGRAADALGYSGFDPRVAGGAISATGRSDSAVALIPTPADHKAAAPGADWMLVVRPFSAPDSSSPLRLCISQHRRNHHNPTINVLLLGDAELRAGSREAIAAARDEVVWLNLDDAVSCIGAGALFADVGSRVVTPPLADGVPDSAWRSACLEEGVAVEQVVDVDDLPGAVGVACLWPWGSVQTVGAIDDTTFTDVTLVGRISAALAAPTARS